MKRVEQVYIESRPLELRYMIFVGERVEKQGPEEAASAQISQMMFSLFRVCNHPSIYPGCS